MLNDTGISTIVIDEIRNLAHHCRLEKVILFGSRARGDFSRTSDIDLAVSGGEIPRFAVEIDEVTSTLLKFDIVDLDGSVQKELLESIEEEGKVLYEKI